jgi:allantoin racemase
MKIFIINPNSDTGMTGLIQETAEEYAKEEFDVLCQPTPGAPGFIENYQDQINAGPGMIQLIKEYEKEYDAFLIACHYDPNLDVMKEITPCPVIGIGEASMKIASMLGHSFSIITTDIHSIPIHEELTRKYHFHGLLASVRAPGTEMAKLQEEQKFMKTAQAALAEDMAEVIILGCAGMSGLGKRLQEKLGVPVLDGVECGLIIASGLVKYGVSTSKIRRYNPL